MKFEKFVQKKFSVLTEADQNPEMGGNPAESQAPEGAPNPPEDSATTQDGEQVQEQIKAATGKLLQLMKDFSGFLRKERDVENIIIKPSAQHISDLLDLMQESELSADPLMGLTKIENEIKKAQGHYKPKTTSVAVEGFSDWKSYIRTK
jgi:molecular chaperone GrpE (heat shock protein)